MGNDDREWVNCGIFFLIALFVGCFLGVLVALDNVNPRTLQEYPDAEANGVKIFFIASGMGLVVSTLQAYYNVVKNGNKSKNWILPVRIIAAVVVAFISTALAFVAFLKSKPYRK